MPFRELQNILLVEGQRSSEAGGNIDQGGGNQRKDVVSTCEERFQLPPNQTRCLLFGGLILVISASENEKAVDKGTCSADAPGPPDPDARQESGQWADGDIDALIDRCPVGGESTENTVS